MKVSILGTGVYGIALASILCKNNEITMWTRFQTEKDSLTINRINPNMSDIVLDSNIKIVNNLTIATNKADLIIIAIPSHFINDLLIELKELIKDSTHICIASKGLNPTDNDFFSNTAKKLGIEKNLGFISGPTFAHEMALKVPIGLTIASLNNNTIEVIKNIFKNDYLKLEETNDTIGVQLCGTIKNVLAISSGIINGLNYPVSTQALLMTNLINYVKNIIEALGGNRNSIFLLAGIGDIWLTCSSTQSRNFSFGKLLGECKTKDEIDNFIKSNTIEGLNNIEIIQNLMLKKNIKSKIIDLMQDIIIQKEKPDKLIGLLLDEE